MSSIPFAKFRALDSNGDPISGAKLNFYEAGTSTRKNTYSDEALTSANANPVVADSNGIFGEIYLMKDGAYKIVYTDASDNTLWSVDDTYAVELISESYRTRIKQIGSNPLDYGAVGDGVADESSEVQDAIDAATGVVDLLGKTFRCDSALTLASGITLKNGTLDFTNCSDNEYITATGTIGSANAITSGNVSKGDTSFDLTSVSGLAAGDWLLVYDGAAMGSGRAGEWAQITDITGSTVTIDRAIRIPYSTGESVKKMTPVTNIILQDLTIQSDTGASGTGDVIDLQFCRNVEIRNVKIDGLKHAGIVIDTCLKVHIKDCVIMEDDTSGDGIYALNGGDEIIIRDCLFSRLDRGIYAGYSDWSIDGLIFNLDVRGNRFNDCKTGIYVDNGAQDTMIDNNHIDGLDAASGYGIRIDTRDVTVRRNRVRNAGDDGIYCVPAYGSSYDDFFVRILDNEVIECDEGILVDTITNTADIGPVEIRGNYLRDIAGIGIKTNIDMNDQCHIDGNTIVDVGASDAAIDVTNTCVGGDVFNTKVSNNSISGTGTGIDTNTTSHLLIANNSVCDARIATGGGWEVNVVGNWIYNPTGYGIYMNGAKTINISGNHIYDGTTAIYLVVNSASVVTAISGNHVNAADHGLYLSTSSGNINISGNTFQILGTGLDLALSGSSKGLVVSGNSINSTSTGAGDYCIHLSGYCDEVVINGNMLYRSTTTEAVIEIDGGAAAAVDNIAVVGNVCRYGDYCLDMGNHTNAMVSGNVFQDHGTGAINGAYDGPQAAGPAADVANIV